jgi:hypothetical protein
MMKRLVSFASLFALVATLHISCSKDDDDDPPKALTKTELITKASWKFDKTEPAAADSYITCFKDNTTTFTADGKGNSADGAVACTPPTGNFNWSFMNNETVLHLDATLIPAGSNDFTIVTLNETNMALSQNVTSPIGPVTITITFKH